jgi:GTP cyclohydrolase II
MKQDAQYFIEAAERLVPLARECAPEADRNRKVPEVFIQALKDAGFYNAMRPREAGGAAIDFKTFIDIVRILSRGDASVGWVSAFLISHEWLLSRLNADAQAEVFKDGAGLAAAAASPPGKAVPVEGGYRVTGRWRYASAVLHANWIIVAAGGAQGPLAVVANVGEGRLVDTWHVPGMRGTGSNDFELQDAFIPAHRVVDFIKYSSRNNDGVALHPSYEMLQYPMYRVLSLIHGAVSVGMAEAALEVFPSLVAHRMRPSNGTPLIEEPGAHAAYGEASYQAKVARLLLEDAVERTVRLYQRGSADPSIEERAQLNLAVTGSGVEAARAIDTLVFHAGASIHRDGHPFDLINRNNQVSRSHGVLDERYAQMLAGRVLLGQGLGSHMDVLY